MPAFGSAAFGSPCLDLPQRQDQELLGWGYLPLKGRRDDQVGLHRYA